MPIERILLAGALEPRDGNLTKDSLLTNCYAEENPEGIMIVKRPGNSLEAVLASPSCTGQGAVFFGGKALFVLCDTLLTTPSIFVTIKASVKAGGL